MTRQSNRATLIGRAGVSVSFAPFISTLDDITQRIQNTFAQLTRSTPREEHPPHAGGHGGLSAFSVFFIGSVPEPASSGSAGTLKPGPLVQGLQAPLGKMGCLGVGISLHQLLQHLPRPIGLTRLSVEIAQLEQRIR